MKKSLVIAIAAGLALLVILGFVAYTPQRHVTNVSVSGAFRDGVYQAKLDAELGRKATVRTGRWHSDADRAAFLAGYQQGSDSSVRMASLPTGPELVGFRNGVADGVDARRADQPFALRSGIIRLNQGHAGAALGRDSQYIRAYANGYQYGYYSDYGYYRDQEMLQSQITSHRNDHF